MRGLYRNELLKIFRQTGFRVVIILVLVAALLSPFAMPVLNGVIAFGERASGGSSYYDERAESAYDVGEKAYFRAIAENERFFEENKLTDSWKYSEYHEQHSRLVSLRVGYEALLSDPGECVEIGKFFPELSDGYDDGNGFTVPPLSYEEKIYDFFGKELTSEEAKLSTEDYYWDYQLVLPEKAEIERQIDAIGSYLAAFEQDILDATAENHYKRMKQQLLASIALTEAELSDTEKANAKKQGDAWQIGQLRLSLERMRKQVDYIDWSIAEKGTPDGWRQTVTECMVSAYEELTQYVEYDEKTFREMSDAGELWNTSGLEMRPYKSYKEYREVMKEARQPALDAIAMADFSRAHDIPLTGTADDGVSAFRGTISFTMTVLTVFMVVAAAMTVANEYSSGTIRLLLIRPRSRAKILLSKYLAVMTYSYSLLLAAFVWQYLVSALCNGSRELFTLTVCFAGGVCFAVPTVVWLLCFTLILSLVGWMLFSFTLMLAVLTHRASLSIILPMLVNMFAQSASSLTILLYTLTDKLHFLKYTILPYLAPGSLISTPADAFLPQGDLDLSALLRGITGIGSTYDFPLWLGLLQIAAIIVLTSFIAFRNFRRQQIKS